MLARAEALERGATHGPLDGLGGARGRLRDARRGPAADPAGVERVAGPEEPALLLQLANDPQDRRPIQPVLSATACWDMSPMAAT
ncbi:MAG TPA: hypothetical protein VEY90_01155, partial [Thermoleophilaceae bacterium]|nr:hypothetical protein [Thermoleophilaceae bacterium]